MNSLIRNSARCVSCRIARILIISDWENRTTYALIRPVSHGMNLLRTTPNERLKRAATATQESEMLPDSRFRQWKERMGSLLTVIGIE